MKVAVVGGGYAGMAAAMTLAEAGVPVTVFEAARELGGRARRVVVNGVSLDNGLHILIGAYEQTLRLVQKLHADPAHALERLPLDWRVHERFRLKAAPLPAPLNLAWGLLTARGAPLRERIAALQFVHRMRSRRFALARDVPVRELLAAHGQGAALVRYFWEPLCLAALNTPPAIASAQVFLNVLRDGLDSGRSASDLMLARIDLSALVPEPVGAFVEARGGNVLTGRTVDTVTPESDQIVVATRESAERFSHAIVAVSPHRAAALISSVPALRETVSLLEGFRYQPIYSIYLQFAAAVPLPAPMLGLAGTGHWLFDRDAICGQRGLLAVVISGEGPHQDMTQDALAAEVHRELEREIGPLPALSWQRVIAEKRATFECSVGLERPGTQTALPGLHLAGDYTQSEYPATIEAAVRSGIAAAKQVLAKMKRASPHL